MKKLLVSLLLISSLFGENCKKDIRKTTIMYEEWENIQKQLLEEKAADESQKSLKV